MTSLWTFHDLAEGLCYEIGLGQDEQYGPPENRGVFRDNEYIRKDGHRRCVRMTCEGLPITEMAMAGAWEAHDAMMDVLREWASRVAPVADALAGLVR